jgi:carboxylate-amine ligase
LKKPIKTFLFCAKTISDIAGGLGFAIGAAGTHPFSHWESQLITDHVRYNEIVNELQEAARSNLILAFMYM